MILALVAVATGLALLVWSADKFIDGSAAFARHYGMSPLLIGMVIVGFGTSAPEMTVSALAALQNNPGIALGNAYGSNICNIALILGLTAIISPVAVHSQVLRQELPILAAVTLVAAWQVADGEVSRFDALALLGIFAAYMGWTVWQSRRQKDDALGTEMAQELATTVMPKGEALFWIIAGLLLLILSSRILVWGAIELAHSLGVSDLIIGLTIVAVGTSLPEMASSIMAARKGEDDIALGNIIGSNLFNTLVVVGLAGIINPLAVAPEVFSRDMLVMTLVTFSLFIICYGFRGPGTITRSKGAIMLTGYVGYTVWLAIGAF